MDYTNVVMACSGPLGMLIPPSIVMIVYGVATGTSISMILLSSIGPGLLFDISFMMYEAYIMKKCNCGEVTPFSSIRYASARL